jgi:hypothetical protein
VDPLGKLVSMYTPTTVHGSPLENGERPSRFCYEVPFSYYDTLIEPNGGVQITTAGCPTPVVVIAPPPDSTVRAVVAPNAREVAMDVLGSLASIPGVSTHGIEKLINAKRISPVDSRQINAEPRALIDGQDICISFGGPNDCLLVARIDAIMREVLVAWVRLQPGELGCTPATALVDSTEVGSPH